MAKSDIISRCLSDNNLLYAVCVIDHILHGVYATRFQFEWQRSIFGEFYLIIFYLAVIVFGLVEFPR